MMIKCLTCGSKFYENEVVSKTMQLTNDYHEYYGTCPVCGGDEIEDCVRCNKCGDWFLHDELEDGVCEDCAEELLEEYKHDIQKCLEVNDGNTEAVEINSIFAHLFTPQQIDDILYRELLVADRIKKVDLTTWIKSFNFNEVVMDIKHGKH